MTQSTNLSSLSFDSLGVTLYKGEPLTPVTFAPKPHESIRYQNVYKQIADKINQIVQVPAFKTAALQEGYVGGDRLNIRVRQQDGNRFIGFKEETETWLHHEFHIDANMDVTVARLADEILKLAGTLQTPDDSDLSSSEGDPSLIRSPSLNDSQNDAFFDPPEETDLEAIQSRDAEIAAQKASIAALTARLDTLTQEHTLLQETTLAESRALQAELFSKDRVLLDKEDRIRRQTAELARLNDAINALCRERDTLIAQLEASEIEFRKAFQLQLERNFSLDSELILARKQLAQQSESSAALTDALKQEILRLGSALEESSKALAVLQAKHDRQDGESRDDVRRFEQQVQALESEKAAIIQERDALQRSVQQLTDEMQAQRVALEEAQDSITALRSELDAARERLIALETQDAAQKADLEALRAKAPAVNTDALRAKDAEIATLRGRVEALALESLRAERGNRPLLVEDALEQIGRLEEENARFRSYLMQAEAQIARDRETFENTIRSLEDSLRQAQEEVHDLDQLRRAVKGRSVSENIALGQKLRTATDALKQVGANNIALGLRIDLQQDTIRQLQETIARLHAEHKVQLDMLAEEFNRLEAEKTGLKVEPVNTRRLIRETAKENSLLNEMAENDDAIIRDNQESIYRLTEQQRAITREKQDLEKRVKELEQAKRSLEAQRDDYREQFEALQKLHNETLDEIRTFAAEQGFSIEA